MTTPSSVSDRLPLLGKDSSDNQLMVSDGNSMSDNWLDRTTSTTPNGGAPYNDRERCRESENASYSDRWPGRHVAVWRFSREDVVLAVLLPISFNESVTRGQRNDPFLQSDGSASSTRWVQPRAAPRCLFDS